MGSAVGSAVGSAAGSAVGSKAGSVAGFGRGSMLASARPRPRRPPPAASRRPAPRTGTPARTRRRPVHVHGRQRLTQNVERPVVRVAAVRAPKSQDLGEVRVLPQLRTASSIVI